MKKEINRQIAIDTEMQGNRQIDISRLINVTIFVYARLNSFRDHHKTTTITLLKEMPDNKNEMTHEKQKYSVNRQI